MSNGVNSALTAEQQVALKKLYLDGSKHSCYQHLPDFISDFVNVSDMLDTTWRDDKPRLRAISEYFDFSKLTSLTDVGANTGYFALTLAYKFKHLRVNAIEGNESHARFMQSVAETAGLQNLRVIPEFLTSQYDHRSVTSDLILHLNVLHHLGVDYSVGSCRLDTFAISATESLRAISPACRYLAFQMGFNWGGNKANPLVAVKDDFGKIRFLEDLLTNSGFEICDIALASRRNGGERFVYRFHPFEEIIDANTHRQLVEAYRLKEESEFFRRPLVFCRSTVNFNGPNPDE